MKWKILNILEDDFYKIKMLSADMRIPVYQVITELLKEREVKK